MSGDGNANNSGGHANVKYKGEDILTEYYYKSFFYEIIP